MKRQKTTFSSFDRSFTTISEIQSSRLDSTSHLNTGFMSARTMYCSAARPVSTSGTMPSTDSINTSFRSALSVYENTPPIPPSRTAATSNVTANAVANQNVKTTQQGPKGSKRQLAGQGSITNFFGKASTSKQQKAATVNEAALVPMATTHRISESASITKPSNAPMCELSSSSAKPNSQRPPDIPPALAKHRLASKSAFKPPFRRTQDIDENGQRYILLSSSPTKAEEGDI